MLKKILYDVLVIVSVMYLWVICVLSWTNNIEATNTHILISILAVGIYLNHKIENSKTKK